MLEAYLFTIIGVVLAQASPGPNLLAVAGAALSSGRKQAMYTVLGVATGMLIWATLVAFGLATVLALFPSVLIAMKIIGGSYLLWMAYKALKSAIQNDELLVSVAKQNASALSAWRHGLFVIMSNPKAALMWTAVGSYLFGNGLSSYQVIAFGPVAAVTALVIYGSYGLLFSTGMAARTYSKFARWIEAAFALSFGGLGGKLVLDGIREIRQ